MRSGHKGIIYIGTDKVASISGGSYTETVTDITDEPCEGDIQHEPGAKDGSGSFTCSAKNADAAQLALQAGAEVELHMWPSGEAAGEEGLTSVGNGQNDKVLIVNRGEEFSSGDKVSRSYDFVRRLIPDTAPV